jgi:hypothetical protein
VLGLTAIFNPDALGLGEADPPAVAKIGDTTKISGVEVTVMGLRESAGELLFRPAAGNKWIIVDVKAKNTNREAYTFFASLQVHVRDAEGRNYNIIQGAPFGPQLKGVFDGTIPVSSELRGEVAFEVPQSGQDYVFLFQAQLFGGSQALWALQ